ncbi:helix-turn-helix domain-containing protein [Roseospirillum parvum]|uniref:Predicted transcriptional regulator, lambda repressor-like DNA-binding domain n=1 Tax=Roseospirillum parvum TaxID=83401 RepID=A0A1G8B8V3_9PROT|nr:helix-turn-helix domain-containing protein [Roseospirillum parvum]SDH29608.1 Predicted transcriptional regulator, lambda repressor-like DNA-binding domain [Roseospirillum parvum]
MNLRAIKHRAIDIRGLLHKRGLTLTGVALAAGLPEAACRVALRQPYYHAEQAIARALDTTAQRLFPERYEPDGTPLHPPKDGSAAAPPPASQKRDCA